MPLLIALIVWLWTPESAANATGFIYFMKSRIERAEAGK
jgi:hypothetical protein